MTMMENFPSCISGERIAEIRDLRRRFEAQRAMARSGGCSEEVAIGLGSDEIGLDALLAVEELLEDRVRLLDAVDALRDLVRRLECVAGLDDGGLHG